MSDPDAPNISEHVTETLPLLTSDRGVITAVNAEYPIFLDSCYESHESGGLVRKDVEAPKVQTTETENETIRTVFSLLRQAYEDPRDGYWPTSLTKEGWDWKCCHLTSKAYGKFVEVMTQHSGIRNKNFLSYDWIPDDDGGRLTVRKKCKFQSLFTRNLADLICEIVAANECFVPSGNWAVLQPQERASVLVGGKLGMRTPCRCSFNATRHEMETIDDHHVQAFILEVAMEDSEKAHQLPDIAQSYISRGSLCVMTAIICLRDEPYVVFSLTRRGKKGFPRPGGMAEYEVIKSVAEVIPENHQSGSLDLRISDFSPSEHPGDLDCSANPEALMQIPYQSLRECLADLYPPQTRLEMWELERFLSR